MTPAVWSLRHRLMAMLGAATLLAWCLSSLWLYRAALEESERLFDAALDHTAHAVLAVVRNEASELTETKGGIGYELGVIDHSEENEIVYQVRGPNGGLVFRSHGAPTVALADAGARGFSFAHVNGKDFRVYSLSTELSVATIHVAQPLAQRVDLARSSAIRLLAPGAGLLFILAGAVAWSVRRATAPVVRYANALDHLEPEGARSVDGSRLPQELQPVARAIDGLLHRVHDALLRERTLTADAAHELRTPLAALRLQAQVARRAKSESERVAALEYLLAGTDRAARMVDSVLTLARFDACTRASIGTARVNLGNLARLVTGEFAPLAEERMIAIHVVSDGASVIGDEDALAIALRNIVGNALRYARKRVEVHCETEQQHVVICVRDDGPGFSPENAQRAFHRFYRGADASHRAEGAGLGLALVLRIVQLHAGSVSIVAGIGSGAGIAIRLERPADVRREA